MPTQKFRLKDPRAEDEILLEERVRALRGVLFVVVDHRARCAEVEFEDDEVTPEEIARAMTEAGCAAEPAG